MNAKPVVALGISAALIVAGVMLEGTDQNPWNLVMAYFLAVTILQLVAARPTAASLVICVLVSGLAIYGAAWTLGAQHAAAPRAALVYIGLVGAVLSSVLVPVRSRQSGPRPGA
jgi:K+-sensing histidine kinase KdpD